MEISRSLVTRKAKSEEVGKRMKTPNEQFQETQLVDSATLSVLQQHS